MKYTILNGGLARQPEGMTVYRSVTQEACFMPHTYVAGPRPGPLLPSMLRHSWKFGTLEVPEFAPRF